MNITLHLLCCQVQVIPWVLSDSNFVRQPSQRLDSNKTVFVGALHGMMTAEALANIMNDLFANVVYAGIDTDKHKYPIGEIHIMVIIYISNDLFEYCRFHNLLEYLTQEIQQFWIKLLEFTKIVNTEFL